MTFQEFDNLLHRYLKGQCTLEEAQLIEKWYASYDEKTSQILGEDQKILVEKRMLNAIHKSDESTKRHFLSLPYVSGVAASLLLLIVTLLWLNQDVKIPPADVAIVAPAETKITNTTSSVLSHGLTDGSTVALQPGSEIRYHAEQFANNRAVTLHGEAFFEVAKDKDHPFLVYAGGLVTKVLGTSFNVNARIDLKEIVVSVKTGKVSVFTQEDAKHQKIAKQEVILTPNQTAIYDTFSDQVVKGHAEPEKEKPKEASKIHFANASLQEIFQVLEHDYGVKIMLDQATLSACKVTTTLANESLFEKLDIICQAIGAEYKVINASILIEGEGCN